MPCPQCYETDASICPKAGDLARNCSGFVLDAAAMRTALGDYPPSLMNTLPHQARSADGPHLDALLGYSSPVNATDALTDDEQAVVSNVDLLVEANLHLCVSICRRCPTFARPSRHVSMR